MLLQVQNLSKAYGSTPAVDEISFDIEAGSFVTILGPSGCGKTTTLRMIAGFERPNSGSILLNGSEIQHTPPFHRNINTVFQSYALFPHMTIFENIAFGLESKKAAKDVVAQKVNDALAKIHLGDHAHRYPGKLSGGQRQRVALARAFVNEPDLLLLDEPLGALDLKLREHMQAELKQLQRDLGIAFLYVTHDQEEAMTLSDKVIVMNNRVIEQIDDPVTLYSAPKTPFVAEFLGGANLVSVDEFHRFCVTLKPAKSDCPGGHISIRPENLRLGAGAKNLTHSFTAGITAVTFHGSFYDISLCTSTGVQLNSKVIRPGEGMTVGADIAVGFSNDDAAWIATKGSSS